MCACLASRCRRESGGVRAHPGQCSRYRSRYPVPSRSNDALAARNAAENDISEGPALDVRKSSPRGTPDARTARPICGVASRASEARDAWRQGRGGRAKWKRHKAGVSGWWAIGSKGEREIDHIDPEEVVNPHQADKRVQGRNAVWPRETRMVLRATADAGPGYVISFAALDSGSSVVRACRRRCTFSAPPPRCGRQRPCRCCGTPPPARRTPP